MRSRHICPDTCRRGSASARTGGPWVCGACGGWREDINRVERDEAIAWNERHAVEEAWLQHYRLPSVLRPVMRVLPPEAVASTRSQEAPDVR